LKVESKETEVKAEIHEAEEESELSQSTMLKHLDENKDKNEDYESLPSVESTTDSIEAISNALNESEAIACPAHRVPCKYGDQCYRVNPVHKQEFSHPGDVDFVSGADGDENRQENDDRPKCEYGTSCYRQNPQHKRDFKHTQSPAQPDDSEQPQTRAPRKRRRKSDKEDESGEDDYDLEDSFINDEENRVDEESDVEDEDYVPDSTEINRELLKEAEWKPTEDDTPEVLELLEDAKNYLRNKKL